MPYSSPKKNPIPGVYRASMPNGKYINLMRVMFTDFCKMDCAFCPNSHWVPRKRYAFKVDELARAFSCTVATRWTAFSSALALLAPVPRPRIGWSRW